MVQRESRSGPPVTNSIYLITIPFNHLSRCHMNQAFLVIAVRRGLLGIAETSSGHYNNDNKRVFAELYTLQWIRNLSYSTF